MKDRLRPLEQEIARAKGDLNELFRRESLASRQGDMGEARRTHLALLEKELDNIGAISRYVDTISPPVARDLSRWQTQTASRFRELRDEADASTLQAWVARELVPLLRRSEQAAHLVASSARVNPDKSAAPFAWPIALEHALKDAAERGSHPRESR